MCAHACMHALRMCVCICTSVLLTGHPVACAVLMCKRSALSYCSMFVCTCMCACPVCKLCILYNSFLVTVWRQLAPFCCATSSKRSSQVPCGRARCQCERQKYSMCHAKHNALCCELTVCVHMVMVIITWCIRMYCTCIIEYHTTNLMLLKACILLVAFCTSKHCRLDQHHCT